jgi:hypothetical protein
VQGRLVLPATAMLSEADERHFVSSLARIIGYFIKRGLLMAFLYKK